LVTDGAKLYSLLLRHAIRQDRTIIFYDCSMKNINHAQQKSVLFSVVKITIPD